MSVQNDSQCTQTASRSWQPAHRLAVALFRGPTNIIAAVVAGAYTTPTLVSGAKYLVTATVRVKETATPGDRQEEAIGMTTIWEYAQLYFMRGWGIPARSGFPEERFDPSSRGIGTPSLTSAIHWATRAGSWWCFNFLQPGGVFFFKRPKAMKP